MNYKKKAQWTFLGVISLVFLLFSTLVFSADQDAAKLESAGKAVENLDYPLKEAQAREEERKKACQAWQEAYEQSRADGTDYFAKKRAAEDARQRANESGRIQEAEEAARLEADAEEAGIKSEESNEITDLRRQEKERAEERAGLWRTEATMAFERVAGEVDAVNKGKFPKEVEKLEDRLKEVQAEILKLFEESSKPCGPENLFGLIRDGKVKAANRGTGQTIGHVADLILTNLTNKPLSVYLAPTIFTSISGDNQGYGSKKLHFVKLRARETVVLSLDGVCLNQNKPPVPDGMMNDLKIENPKKAISSTQDTCSDNIFR